MLDTCGWLGIAAILTPLADSDILIVSHFVCNQTHVFLTGWQLGAVSCVLEDTKYIFECTPDSLQRYVGMWVASCWCADVRTSALTP